MPKICFHCRPLDLLVTYTFASSSVVPKFCLFSIIPLRRWSFLEDWRTTEMTNKTISTRHLVFSCFEAIFGRFSGFNLPHLHHFQCLTTPNVKQPCYDEKPSQLWDAHLFSMMFARDATDWRSGSRRQGNFDGLCNGWWRGRLRSMTKYRPVEHSSVHGDIKRSKSKEEFPFPMYFKYKARTQVKIIAWIVTAVSIR